MLSLTPAERKALKARAHPLNPVVMIGNDGVTPAVVREANVALSAHELIKVRVAGDDRAARTAAYETLCNELEAAPVQHIGKILVLYRPKLEDAAAAAKPKRRKASEVHQPKKRALSASSK